MHEITISLLILYALALLCFFAIVAICLILWRDDPIDNDYKAPVKLEPGEGFTVDIGKTKYPKKVKK